MAKVFRRDIDGTLIPMSQVDIPAPMPPVVINGVEQPHEPCGQVYAKLSAVKVDGKTGERTDLGVLSTRIVTTAFLAVVTGCMRGNSGNLITIQAFIRHGCGTGTVAENAGDTVLGAETAYVTDGQRAEGTRDGSGATYKSVATVTFVGVPTTLAITEHGLFYGAVIDEGTLLDRSKFSPITVVSTDQIIFTYTLTCTGTL
jgi:hypothetical protein